MRFAKWVFTLAGIYGLVTIPLTYFAEGQLARRYGALGQPLWFYGFLSVVLVFQLVYLQTGRDPVRYRPFMLLSLLAKLSFVVTAAAMYAVGRTPVEQALVTGPDLIWSALFVIAYLRTPRG
ncbi:MAG: hypothetical protein ACJ798_14245 [Phenylobacterium sp.]